MCNKMNVARKQKETRAHTHTQTRNVPVQGNKNEIGRFFHATLELVEQRRLKAHQRHPYVHRVFQGIDVLSNREHANMSSTDERSDKQCSHYRIQWGHNTSTYSSRVINYCSQNTLKCSSGQCTTAKISNVRQVSESDNADTHKPVFGHVDHAASNAVRSRISIKEHSTWRVEQHVQCD